jgi:chaperonin GroEL
MTPSIIGPGPAGWHELRRGMAVLARIAGATLGPSGRRVLLEQAFATPKLTGSGYEIARTLDLADPLQNAGVRLLREVAWRTKDAVGDGTATAIVIAHAIVAAATPAIAAGIDVVALRGELLQAGEAVGGALDRLARPLSGEAELIALAMRVAHDDAGLGREIARAVYELRQDGVVLVEESNRREDELILRRGMRFPGGYLSAHFATDPEGRVAALADPYLLIVAEKITSLQAIIPALQAFASAGKALVIIAEDVSGPALATLVVNKQQAGCKIAAVKAPGFGQWRRPMLEDIAILSGGVVVAADRGSSLEHLRPEMLGRARHVRIECDATTIVAGAGDADAIARHCSMLRREIARERYLSFDREKHQERLARLTSGVATLRVAGATATQRADRIEGARAVVGAARAAFAEGVVPGGGAALLHAAQEIAGATQCSPERRAAFDILRRALAAPARCIAYNAGAEPSEIEAGLRADGNAVQTFDAATRRVVDAWDVGLLDPLPVMRAAFRNALSVATGLVGLGGAIVTAAGTAKA